MTKEDPNKKGYVYILVNPAFPGFLKIGKTAKEPEVRARELSSGSGVPAPYAVAWDAFVDDCDHVEKLIHEKLAHARSRNDREFFAIPLKNAISIISGVVAAFAFEPDTVSANSVRAVCASNSPAEPKVLTPLKSPVETQAASCLEAAGYSDAEIDNLYAVIHSFEQVVLPRKKEREAEAEEILRRFKGRYSTEILEKVFDLVDKGPIGPITGPWFGQLLVRPNRNRLYRCSTAELSILIDQLRETGDLGCLEEWRRTGHRGMNKGLATLFMYLHAPDRYNVWLPKTHSGLSRLRELGTEFPKKEMRAEEYRLFFRTFNENVISVREQDGFAPQAMDWILFAVDELKTNPQNHSLRVLHLAGRD